MDGNDYVVGVHLGGCNAEKKNVALRLNKQRREKINEMIGEAVGKMDLSKE